MTEMTNPAPIDMVLHCPKCGTQHIDGPENDESYSEKLHESSWWELGGEMPERWTNPPHRSHLCHHCGHIWRPADVPTNGVAAIKTRGKNDSPPARTRRDTDSDIVGAAMDVLDLSFQPRKES